MLEYLAMHGDLVLLALTAGANFATALLAYRTQRHAVEIVKAVEPALKAPR
jgi:hypothetical protein